MPKSVFCRTRTAAIVSAVSVLTGGQGKVTKMFLFFNFDWMPGFLLIFILSMPLCQAQNNREEVISFEDAYKRIYNITRLNENERPHIDGKLDEDIWKKKGEWSAKFSQVIPFERVYTASATHVKLFYDNENIYVGVYCKDEFPEKMNAFIGNRDDNSNGDLISIAFDTYHDYRIAPEFNINLGGNKTDLTVTDKLSVNLSWNAVWEGRTSMHIQDSCWTAELRIPFSQLRYNRETADGVWGLHVRRIIRRNNEVQNWSLIPIKNNGHVFSFGEMHGMNDLPKPRGVEFLPYVMGKYGNEPKIAGSPFQNGHKWEGNVGLDAKFALNDYTMDLTVNPDYGQVEQDPSVMNLSAYETFYDEKRPFFLEGRHILEFENEDDKMFYTRRVGATPTYRPQEIDNIHSFAETPKNIPIIGALKLTGTNKYGLTIGMLESITARTTSKVERDGVRDKEETEPLTNYTIARVQKNWHGNTLLGGMLTSVNRALNKPHLKDLMIENAFTGGLDFTQYFLNRLYYIEAKGMFSSLHGSASAILHTKRNAVHYYQRESGKTYLDPDIDKKSLQGTGGYLKAGKTGNAQWVYSETFSWSSPGFDLNDAGYMKQADYKSNVSEVGYRKTDPWGPFRFARINLTQKNVWNYGGTAINNDVGVQWRALTTRYRFAMDIKETFSWNTIDSRILRGGPDMRYEPNFETSITLNTDQAKRVMLKFGYNGKHFSDGVTAYNEIRPSLTFRLGKHIHLVGQVNYAWNKDNLQYVAGTTASNGSSFSGSFSGSSESSFSGSSGGSFSSSSGSSFGGSFGSSPGSSSGSLLSGSFGSSSGSSSRMQYIMGRMKQNTYGVTLKLQVNVTPDISLQYYGAPFTSVARYTHFKVAADTKSHSYKKRFTDFDPDNVRYADGVYETSLHGENYLFKNPDFSFNEFRSNFVARWEYLPGSTMYFVWEHNRGGRDNQYHSGWGANLDRMFGFSAVNTFMVKINYWFNL